MPSREGISDTMPGSTRRRGGAIVRRQFQSAGVADVFERIMVTHGYSVARFEEAPARVVTDAPEELVDRVAVVAAARAGRRPRSDRDARDPEVDEERVPPSGIRTRSRSRSLHRVRRHNGVVHYPFEFRFVADDGIERRAVLYATDKAHAARLIRRYFDARDVVLQPRAEVRVRWLPVSGPL